MFKRSVLTLVLVCSLICSCASLASGDAPAPGYAVIGRFAPTNLPPGGEGRLVLYVYNIGGVGNSTDLSLTNILPAGVVAKTGEIGGESTAVSCTGSTEVTCAVGSIAPGGEPARILIPVSVSGSPSSEPDRVTVSGGGSLGVVNTTVPVHYGTGPAPVGMANADAWISNQDGTIDTQAGSHPYELTLAFATNSIGVGHAEEQPNGDPRALDVNLPPGLVGEPGAVPKCTREEFDAEECQPNTRIGENYASVSGAGLLSQQVYNLVPPPGIAAQFAFTFNGTSIFLDARVRSGGDYGITEHANVPQRKIVFNTTTIWGIPGEHETGAGDKPLLILPTSCGASPQFSIEELGTWQNESLSLDPPVLSGGEG